MDSPCQLDQDCEDFWRDYRNFENDMEDESVIDDELDHRISEIREILQEGTQAKRCLQDCDHDDDSLPSPQRNQNELIILQSKSAASIKALRKEVKLAKQTIMDMKSDVKEYKEEKRRKHFSRKSVTSAREINIGGLWCILQEEQDKLLDREEDLSRREGEIAETENKLMAIRSALNERQIEIDAREAQCRLQEITSQEQKFAQTLKQEQQKVEEVRLQELLQEAKTLKAEAHADRIRVDHLQSKSQLDQTKLLVKKRIIDDSFKIILQSFEIFKTAVQNIPTVNNADDEAIRDMLSSTMPNEDEKSSLESRCGSACRMIEACSIVVNQLCQKRGPRSEATTQTDPSVISSIEKACDTESRLPQKLIKVPDSMNDQSESQYKDFYPPFSISSHSSNSLAKRLISMRPVLLAYSLSGKIEHLYDNYTVWKLQNDRLLVDMSIIGSSTVFTHLHKSICRSMSDSSEHIAMDDVMLSFAIVQDIEFNHGCQSNYFTQQTIADHIVGASPNSQKGSLLEENLIDRPSVSVCRANEDIQPVNGVLTQKSSSIWDQLSSREVDNLRAARSLIPLKLFNEDVRPIEAQKSTLLDQKEESTVDRSGRAVDADAVIKLVGQEAQGSKIVSQWLSSLLVRNHSNVHS